MEIDVTTYVEEHDCSLYSNSVAESGRENIGELTWNNAMEQVSECSLVTPEQQDELRDFLVDTGGWTIDEVFNMTDQETNALLLQFIAGDVRELERYDTYEEYEKAAMDGTVPSSLWRDDSGRWIYHVGY